MPTEVLTRALRRFLTPYRNNPYRYGCRRHHALLGSILPVVPKVPMSNTQAPYCKTKDKYRPQPHTALADDEERKEYDD